MQTPLTITFRNLTSSAALEADIRERVGKLEKFYGDIIGCCVMLEMRHRRHRHGNHYHVLIDVTVPGGSLIADREADAHHAYTDAYVAVRDAFASMRRQLKEFRRWQARRAKAHSSASHARVAELHPESDYGCVEMADGSVLYFHRNNVADAEFDRLQVGDAVEVDEAAGMLGLQPNRVRLPTRRAHAR